MINIICEIEMWFISAFVLAFVSHFQRCNAQVLYHHAGFNWTGYVFIMSSHEM